MIAALMPISKEIESTYRDLACLTGVQVHQASMNLLGTLRITCKNNLGIGAVRNCLLDQLCTVGASSSGLRADAALYSTGEIGGVVHALRGNFVGAESLLELLLQSRTDCGTEVTGLSGSAGEDIGDGLAGTGSDVVGRGGAADAESAIRDGELRGASLNASRLVGGKGHGSSG